MILGVMNNNNSESSVLFSLVLNSQPNRGISFNPGTPRLSVAFRTAFYATDYQGFTIINRQFQFGFLGVYSTVSKLISWILSSIRSLLSFTFMVIFLPFLAIWGVTSNLRLASTYTVVKALFSSRVVTGSFNALFNRRLFIVQG